jgi:fumarate reductase subunit D
MIQTDRTNFVAWGLGSGGGVYSGIFPPEFLSGIKLSLAQIPAHSVTDRFIDLIWAILTAIIVTAVSFFITKVLQKLTKRKHGTRTT